MKSKLELETGRIADFSSAEGESTAQRYLTLGGACGAWLFVALDATVFGFVILPISHTFTASLSEDVSTVAWFLLATGIGGFFLGNIADKIGRKTTLLLSVLVYATGTLLCGFTHSIFELHVCRFTVGIGVGGLWSAAVALISEIWPASGRAKAISVKQAGWSGGSLLAAVFAWTLPDASNPKSWRALFILAATPAYAIAVFILLSVKESPVWLDNRPFRKGSTKKANLLTIFSPEYRRTTLVSLLISILGMYGYRIITTFTPTYLQTILHVHVDQAPVFLVWTGIGATFGYLLYGVLAERFGRRGAFAGFFVGISIIVPMFTFGATLIPLILRTAPSSSRRTTSQSSVRLPRCLVSSLATPAVSVRGMRSFSWQAFVRQQLTFASTFDALEQSQESSWFLRSSQSSDSLRPFA